MRLMRRRRIVLLVAAVGILACALGRASGADPAGGILACAASSASAPATSAASRPALSRYADTHAAVQGDSHKGDRNTPALTFTQEGGSVAVRCEYWQVEHKADVGGCIASIVFPHGSGKNLLSAPVSSRIRFSRVIDSPRENSVEYPSFWERLDAKATLTAQRQPDGSVVVLAEGIYSDKDAKTIPVRFRHRYQYGPWGLLTSDLEILPQESVSGVVEVGALELPLRRGLTDEYVIDHPICNPNSDLRGGGRDRGRGSGSACP